MLSRYGSVRQKDLAVSEPADIDRACGELKLIDNATGLFHKQTHRFSFLHLGFESSAFYFPQSGTICQASVYYMPDRVLRLNLLCCNYRPISVDY